MIISERINIVRLKIWVKKISQFLTLPLPLLAILIFHEFWKSEQNGLQKYYHY